jgi:ribonuclease HI
MVLLFIQETHNGGWGFIVRDHQGEAIMAGAGRLTTVPDVLSAEAAACAKALQSATNFGISQVQVEVDSALLQQALLTSSMDLVASGMLIRDTRVLLVPRNCNSAAHALASLGMSWDPGESCVWTNPLPEFVKSLVTRDVVESLVSITRP